MDSRKSPGPQLIAGTEGDAPRGGSLGSSLRAAVLFAAALIPLTSEPARSQEGSAAATVMLGDEELTIDRTLCYFEEQPRAGLGGVWTHTSQATGANAAGEPVVIGLDRARSEEGEVGDSIYVDIGEPGADDAVGFTASGPEGLIEFGDDSVSAQDVEVAVFGSDPVALSVQFDC